MVPAESDLLCEGCGYTLNGLPREGNCPECGRPIVQSIGEHRVLPVWESTSSKFRAFFSTTLKVIFRPTAFYQNIQTRNQDDLDAVFGHIQWLISSLLFAAAAVLHFGLMSRITGDVNLNFPSLIMVLALGTPFIASLLLGLTWLAARLSAWEARYRGLRLPLPVVLRGMRYHAAHYLPVGTVVLAIVLGYFILLRNGITTRESDTAYLYVLCAAVVMAALYLFWTYWIAMRNMMYANR